MDFQILSSTPSSIMLSGLVWPKPFPKEHSPILVYISSEAWANNAVFNLHVKGNIVKIVHQVNFDALLGIVDGVGVDLRLVLAEEITNSRLEEHLEIVDVVDREGG